MLLLAVLLAAYWPAHDGRPVWDDDAHMTRAELRGVDGLGRIWFDLGATQQYYPLAHSAFWVMHRAFGDDTTGYHIVNIVLHALSALLIVAIVRRLRLPGAWLAAVIFALHPVHVESVAWITELKNTLSGVLYLGAALVYLRFDEERNPRHYAAAAALFVLALLAKTVVATLPAALLVVFWWQRGRVEWRRDAVPLLPFFAAGIIAGLFTAWVERRFIGAEGFEFELSLVQRLLLAGRAVWFYLATLAWPVHLSFIYPRWTIDAQDVSQYLWLAAALAALGVFWILRRRTRSPLAVALLYIGTLFPALGFFDVYPFRYSFVADHFQYLASVPVIVAAGALMTVAFGRLAPGRPALPIVATTVIAVVLAARVNAESRQYADAQTLYRTTLDRNSECWMCHNNLAALALAAQPADLDTAAMHLRASLATNPANAEAHDNLGLVLRLRGQYAESAREHEEAIRLRPQFAAALNNLGVSLQALGKPLDALARYQEAARLAPRLPEVHHNLARVLLELGRTDEALEAVDEALRLNPAYGDAHENRGNVLVRLRRYDGAAAAYGEAARLSPASAAVRYKAGLALRSAGRVAESVSAFEEAVRLQPAYGPLRLDLADTLANAGRNDDAIPHYLAALRAPEGIDLPEAHNNLGVALAIAGRREDAIAHFREALRLRPDFEQARANLARAGVR